MSIQAAVVALNKEIATLDTKRERLVTLRDALVRETDDATGNAIAITATKGAKRGPKPGNAKKKALAKKAAATKRVLSPEARKKIADAQKARWAKSKAKKTA